MSWGSSMLRNIPAIGGYPQAARFFESKSICKGKKWGGDERPMFNVRSHHYRLVRGPDGAYYEAVLYKTPMVRWHAPNKDGESMVYVTSYDLRATSRSFVEGLGWAAWGSSFNAAFPLNPNTDDDYTAANGVVVPAGWSVVLCVVGKRIIVRKSAHRPVFVLRSSKEDSEKRAAFKVRVETFADLMMLRLPSFKEASNTTSRQRSVAFASYHHFITTEQRSAVAGLALYLRDDEKFDPGMGLEALGCGVYSLLDAARVSAAGGWYDWTQKKVVSATTIQPVTPEEFRRSYVSALIKLVGLDKQSDKEELPQFGKLPRRYLYR